MHTELFVVGAGVAGLSAAIGAARAGLSVVVADRAGVAGGKLRTARVAGHDIDCGPTVLTMSAVFEELFREAGVELSSVLALEPLAVLARHRWRDGSSLDLFPDVEQSAVAIERAFGARDAAAYRAFAEHGAQIFETVEEPFLLSQRPTPLDMLRHAARVGPSVLTRIDAHRTMWSALGSFFEDERLRQLFGRYATYVGSSPFAAPATLNLIAHVERVGVHVVRGGMGRLGAALEQLARSLGVTFLLDTPVDELLVEGDRVVGARLGGASVGAELRSDAVVFAADVAALASGLHGARAARAVKAQAPAQRSLSALTWSIVGEAPEAALAHHTVLFGEDYRREMATLFDERRLPEDPTVYVCAQDRGASGRRGGEERFFVIVNAPATEDTRPLTDEEIDRCEHATFQRLRAEGMIFSEQRMERTTPRDFALRFPGTGGAIYGAASHGSTAALSRPGARTKLRGLYLASGSAHPGAGVPMAALSGRLAVRALLEDRASRSPSTRAATRGSTSTP